MKLGKLVTLLADQYPEPDDFLSWVFDTGAMTAFRNLNEQLEDYEKTVPVQDEIQ